MRPSGVLIALAGAFIVCQVVVASPSVIDLMGL
jgi:hypothetical protein